MKGGQESLDVTDGEDRAEIDDRDGGVERGGEGGGGANPAKMITRRKLRKGMMR